MSGKVHAYAIAIQELENEQQRIRMALHHLKALLAYRQGEEASQKEEQPPLEPDSEKRLPRGLLSVEVSKILLAKNTPMTPSEISSELLKEGVSASPGSVSTMLVRGNRAGKFVKESYGKWTLPEKATGTGANTAMSHIVSRALHG